MIRATIGELIAERRVGPFVIGQPVARLGRVCDLDRYFEPGLIDKGEMLSCIYSFVAVEFLCERKLNEYVIRSITAEPSRRIPPFLKLESVFDFEWSGICRYMEEGDVLQIVRELGFTVDDREETEYNMQLQVNKFARFLFSKDDDERFLFNQVEVG